jgi:hypothetical protein
MLAACSGGGGGGGGGGDGDSDGGGGSSTANAIADAGPTLDLTRNAAASLDGSGSSDPDGDTLTYRWTQVSGPDVTGGAGFMTGISPAFTAPLDVSTLFFDLTVNDGNGDSATDRVQVNVLEHTGPSFYVDGDIGNDTTGDGSRGNPFATISMAINSIPGPNHDIYVRTRAGGLAYSENGATLMLPNGSSLYGGYGDDWVRDVTGNRTTLRGNRQAVHFVDVDEDAWFSGFVLLAGNSNLSPPSISSGVSVEAGDATLYIQDNEVRAGSVIAETANPMDSYGLRLVGVNGVRVLRNSIIAGDGGFGSDGDDGINGPNGNSGSSASGQSGGADGLSGCPFSSSPGCVVGVSNHGGVGGRGGNNNGGNGNDGANGRNYTDGITGTGGNGGTGGSGGSSTNTGGSGGGGIGGNNNRGRLLVGIGGRGGSGDGFITGGFYANDAAQDGNDGDHGDGGGGGGGGEGGLAFGPTGGGGGGGGAGGVGGTGGEAGFRGGASIGLLLSSVADAVIDGNTITSGQGGPGGAGGTGGFGGNGGNGGNGRAKDNSGEAGGHGGGGGHGGEGGQGGAGAGGPSYSIMIGANIAPTISNNTLIASTGGEPGADGDHGSGGALGGRFGNQGSTGGNGATSHNSIRASFGSLAEGGWSFNVYDEDTGDGMTPVLNGNNFITGTAGNRGSAGERNF